MLVQPQGLLCLTSDIGARFVKVEEIEKFTSRPFYVIVSDTNEIVSVPLS